MTRLLPAENIASAVELLLGDIPHWVFPPSFAAACRDLDHYIGALATELAATLELDGGGPLHPDRLLADRAWSPDGHLALLWLLETLALYGRADRVDGGWRLRPTHGTPTAAHVRDAALAAMPTAQPAYDVFHLAATSLPDVLAGTLSGESALFGIGAMGLWFDYFSNSNPLYEPCNAVTAVAVERAAGADATILEVGGGGGSAAEAILRRLESVGRPPSRYLFTEVHPAFLRRGSRTLNGSGLAVADAVEAARYDIDRDPSEQGIGDQRFDVVAAVNTLHLATDPVLALQRLGSLLAPGGTLVLGELVRPAGDRGVHLELPFTLLEAYRRAPLVDGIRTRPGFMTAAGWREGLARAGFDHVDLLPARLDECVAAYPGFYSVAITAGRTR